MRFFNVDVVNSYALRLAGIDRHTPDPEGGKIERDPSGEPNGLLRASAKIQVRSLVPKPGLAQRLEALRLAYADLHRFGITSVVEPGLTPEEIRAYQVSYEQGDLSVRVNLMPSWHGFHDDEQEAQLDGRARALGLYSGWGDEWLRLGALKMAIDGGTTPHTAYMYEPFEGETEVVDYNRLPLEALHRHFRTAQELGWDVGIHCCGDRAQDMAVDTLAQVARELPRPDPATASSTATSPRRGRWSRWPNTRSRPYSSPPSSTGRATCSSATWAAAGLRTTSRRAPTWTAASSSPPVPT